MMRTSLNLSRRPFTNHRLFWAGVLAIFFFSLWLLLWIAAEKTTVSAKADQVNLSIKAHQALFEKAREDEEKRKLSEKKTEITEQQAVQLVAARQLIEVKSFSWNKMISDLEGFVPKDAKIFSIKVEEVVDAGQGVGARVEVKAIGKTPAQMTEMMESLEKSAGLFTVGQSVQDAATDAGEIPFTLNLTYRPTRGAGQ